MITAAGSFGTLGATVAYVAATGGRLVTLGWALGVAALVVLALGLVLRWPTTVPWALLFAGAGFIVGRIGHTSVDGWAAVVGALLLGSAELASWSIEHDARIHSEAALIKRRIRNLALLLAAALLVSFLLLGTAALSTSAGVLLAAVGVSAAVGAVAVVLRLART